MTAAVEKAEKKLVEKVVARHDEDPLELLSMLMEIQERQNYLPRGVLDYLSEKLDIPLSHIYRMATFYEALSLKPLGRCQIQVCMGTACHVRGAAGVLSKLERVLQIKAGEVTPDQRFGLKKVNCLGACALGPVVLIDGEYHGNMTSLKAEKVLKSLENSGVEDVNKDV